MLYTAVSPFALMTTLALAQTDRPSPTNRERGVTAGRVIDSRGAGGGHRASDLREQQTVRVPLLEAVEAAESRESGRAIEAGFEIGGGGYYEIKVLGADGMIMRHFVDANSGQVTRTDRQQMEEFFTRLRLIDMQNARTTLRQAIVIAEQRVGGRAAEAEVERDGDTVSYRVTVTNNDRLQEIKVSADGQVTSLR
ncbi:hypothetical protein D9599_23000 [Roseomonas sp. KE2513]|nr:hypothetical protein [Roseomonas sp. KE2513]